MTSVVAKNLLADRRNESERVCVSQMTAHWSFR